jgi:signal peptidase II
VLLVAVGAGVYGLDRLSKTLAEDHLAGRPPIVVVPNVVQLRFATNSGGAFSLFPDHPWVFVTATVIVCVAILLTSWRLRSALSAVALGMVLGGALGNLTDRIVRGPGLSGRVIDFIDFHVWPVFNTADSAIVVGAALMILAGARRESGPERGVGPEADANPG